MMELGSNPEGEPQAAGAAAHWHEQRAFLGRAEPSTPLNLYP